MQEVQQLLTFEQAFQILGVADEKDALAQQRLGELLPLWCLRRSVEVDEITDDGFCLNARGRGRAVEAQHYRAYPEETITVSSHTADYCVVLEYIPVRFEVSVGYRDDGEVVPVDRDALYQDDLVEDLVRFSMDRQDSCDVGSSADPISRKCLPSHLKVGVIENCGTVGNFSVVASTLTLGIALVDVDITACKVDPGVITGMHARVGTLLHVIESTQDVGGGFPTANVVQRRHQLIERRHVIEADYGVCVQTIAEYRPAAVKRGHSH